MPPTAPPPTTPSPDDPPDDWLDGPPDDLVADGRRRLLVLAVPAAVAAVLGGLTLTGSLTATDLLDPGPLVRYTLPVARTVHDLAAALTVGLLVLTAVALPGGRKVGGEARDVRSHALRWAAVAATT